MEITYSPSPVARIPARRNNNLALPAGVQLDGSGSRTRERSDVAGPSRGASRHGQSPTRRAINGSGTNNRPIETIDLTNDSSDDSSDEGVPLAMPGRYEYLDRRRLPSPIEISPSPSPPPRHRVRRVTDDEYANAMGDIERTLGRRRIDAEALIRADVEDHRRREILSPNPIRPRPRIGLGGAVLRAGNRQINFNGRQRQETPPTRHSPAVPSPSARATRFGNTANADNQIRPQDDLDNRVPDMRWLDRLAGAELAGAAGRRIAEAIRMWNAVAWGNAEGPGLAGPGPARGGEDIVEQRISTLKMIKRDPPGEGTVTTFDLDAINGTIVLDENGQVAPKNLYLDCAVCHDPLLLSAAYNSPEDRVWALRCGHMIDQKCLEKISIPTTPEQIKNTINFINPLPLDQPPKKKSRSRKPPKANANRPAIHIYSCPVAGCGWGHTAMKKEEGWVQTPDGGAVQGFM